MSLVSDIYHWIAPFIAGAAVLVFIGWTVKESDEPWRMVLKWILTGVVFTFMFKVVAPLVGRFDYAAAFIGIPLAAVSGLFLLFIWRGTITELIAQPFASLYNGGSAPPEPQPIYSTAYAHQKRGEFEEALAEVRAQLERFPTDLEGNMLEAEILSQNLKRLEEAEAVVERYTSQPGHHPKNIAFAWFSMTDWHLASGKVEEARHCLKRLTECLPDTEFSLAAAQRLARLDAPELKKLDPKQYALPKMSNRVGLETRRKAVHELAAEEPTEYEPANPVSGETAADCLKRLEKHPLDMATRERLAVLYAQEYRRLDLATDQLEQMLQHPHQPTRSIVRWLNLLADLQVKFGRDYESARQTLQRIIDRDPRGAAADMARNRLNLLKLEFKALEKTDDVRMGVYEQNIGLKRARRERGDEVGGAN